MEGLSFTLPAADNLLVTGPAGAGKTSLFRAVRALWPLLAGRIALPAQGELLYLPQRPYLPIGSLAEQVCRSTHHMSV